MSRDPRVGYARVMARCNLAEVTGLRRSPLRTQTMHGPSGPSETVRKRSTAMRAAYGLPPLEAPA